MAVVATVAAATVAGTAVAEAVASVAEHQQKAR
jgi:hypothetical protein